MTDFKVGDEVIAVSGVAHRTGCLANFVTLNSAFVAHKPQNLTFAEAATLPFDSLIAVDALHAIAKIKAGDRVLIHHAADEIGQFAMQVAQRAGAEIFVTERLEKQNFLQSQGIQRVMNAQTHDFAARILALTNSAGVDILLNTLSEEFIDTNLAVLAQDGYYIDLNFAGVQDRQKITQTRPDVHYAHYEFDVKDTLETRPDFVRTTLLHTVQEIEAGTFQPLPYTLFPITDVSSAFHFMAQGKNVGKVILALPTSARAPGNFGRNEPSELSINADSAYLITGGPDRLTLDIADWLVQQGARHLIMVARDGAISKLPKAAVHKLEAAGAQVVVIDADLSAPQDIERVITTAGASLRGIIYAADSFANSLLPNQTTAQFEGGFASNVQGAWNLHLATQALPLDFFICFSANPPLMDSQAMTGLQGRAIDSAISAFLDALAHHRRALGLPAHSINWSGWAEAPMSAEAGNRATWAQTENSAITPEMRLQLLDIILTQPDAQ
ncbi:MAG: KR domain-containing protein, partial [Caldilineaceae bacterium]|nr:KR domain-containing protein [Caldilineaceae bacterium]